jgi:apolipoprotein D and lipocalin family protein
MTFFPTTFSSSAVLVALVFFLSACSVMPPAEFPREESVDVPRYMGAWYVIAHIPPGATKNSYNSIERYQLNKSGEIETLFTYLEGGFDGEQVAMRPLGFALEESKGAVWEMQFFWPLKMEYTISYVDDNYETTIVARSKRDWVWIMARTPIITEEKYSDLLNRVELLGYSLENIRKVPQQSIADRRDDPNAR